MSEGIDRTPPGDELGLLGQTLEGKYRVEQVVGEGGFATVYQATHLVWKRPVAIKVFRAFADLSNAQRQRLVDDFLQEGALLAELSERSAAIVQARDVGTLTTPRGEQVPYMVLEWLEGASLEAILLDARQRALLPFTAEQTMRILDPVAEALGLAHKRGIAHRDVKPANIFVRGDPRAGDVVVKLLDFGIAKVVQDAQKLGGSFQRTSGHVTSFTPAYGAPEQFSRSHGATGPWTDVFALALVAVELLTGREPLEGDTIVQLGYCSADLRRRPTPRTLGAAVSDDVEAVFAKALAVPVDARYQSVGDFWNALRAALAMAPMRTLAETEPKSGVDTGPASLAETVAADAPPSGAPPSTTPQPRVQASRAGLVAAAGLAAAIVLGGGVFLGVRDRGAKGAASWAPPPSSVPVSRAEPTCPPGSVRIPGGKFFMGTDEPPKPYLENEKPAHQVELRPYCMDQYEVTTARYKACSDKGECKRAGETNRAADIATPAQRAAYDPLCNIREPQARAEHPINCVDWEQAQTYCKAAGGRLPTEAEWEFAARGPDGRTYPWGDEVPGAGYLNACGKECMDWFVKHKVQRDVPGMMYPEDDKWEATAPVGSFPKGASRYGIHDVVGNVWEWTADYYGPYEKTADVQRDPKGPPSGDERVIRGGGWNGAFPEWVRPTFRFHADPTNRTHGIGFRCVYDLPAVDPQSPAR
jgi:formylglycine-generating enzyme required for sulfatase activity/serine/threonine protein kinase